MLNSPLLAVDDDSTPLHTCNVFVEGC